MTDLISVAKEVTTVDEAVMKVLPFISTMIGFIPGGQAAVPLMPLISEFLQVIDNAAKEVAVGNTGAGADVILKEIIDHLTLGKPNSPILSGGITAGPDASQVGSG